MRGRHSTPVRQGFTLPGQPALVIFPFRRYASVMYREQEIPFVYEHGVLKPEGRVDLPEGARGIAHIREADTSAASEPSPARRRALEVIRRIGELGEFDSGGRKLTRDEMHERG